MSGYLAAYQAASGLLGSEDSGGGADLSSLGAAAGANGGSAPAVPDQTSQQVENRIAVSAPILNFGGSIINPGGPENGGGGVGLPFGQGQQQVPPGTNVPFSSYSRATPVSGVQLASYSPSNPLVQPTFFDTVNKGPSLQLSGLAIATVAAVGLVIFLIYRRSGGR